MYHPLTKSLILRNTQMTTFDVKNRKESKIDKKRVEIRKHKCINNSYILSRNNIMNHQFKMCKLRCTDLEG